ncbi:hypothetical protein LEMLEM_LOCUS21580 [Lemmus lemmus]
MWRQKVDLKLSVWKTQESSARRRLTGRPKIFRMPFDILIQQALSANFMLGTAYRSTSPMRSITY